MLVIRRKYRYFCTIQLRSVDRVRKRCHPLLRSARKARPYEPESSQGLFFETHTDAFESLDTEERVSSASCSMYRRPEDRTYPKISAVRHRTFEGTSVRYSAGMIWSVSMLSFTTKHFPVYVDGLSRCRGISLMRGSDRKSVV